MSLFIGWHGIYSEIFLMSRLLTDFRRGDLSGRCRYPLELEYVPQISQIYTDLLSSGFFCHADFADDADFFHRGFLFIGWHGINSEVSCWGDYSRIFADATCPVVADTPWDQTKRFIRDSIKSVKICEICGTKNSHEEKSAPSAKSAWQNNSSIFRAPAIGQRPNIRENPWVIR